MTEGRISAADGRRASWELELDSMDKRTRFQVNRVDTANADEGEMEKLTNNPDQDDLPDAAGELKKFANSNRQMILPPQKNFSISASLPLRLLGENEIFAGVGLREKPCVLHAPALYSPERVHSFIVWEKNSAASFALGCCDSLVGTRGPAPPLFLS